MVIVSNGGTVSLGYGQVFKGPEPEKIMENNGRKREVNYPISHNYFPYFT
jgi:hypothetical protein